MTAVASAGGTSPAVQRARSSALAARRAAADICGADGSCACSSTQAPQPSEVATIAIDSTVWILRPGKVTRIARTLNRA